MKYKLINYYPPYTKKDIGKIVWFGPNNLLNPEKYPEFWELVVEKDYEILSFLTETNVILIPKFENFKFFIPKDFAWDGNRHRTEEFILKNSNTYKIHSIKRLSDDEIFTVGDKVSYNKVSNKFETTYIIEQFLINKESIVTNFTTKGNTLYLTSDIKWNKIKKPLFTTEDGVDIFKDDIFYHTSGWTEPKTVVAKSKHLNYSLPMDKLYSKKEKAEEYILMNKPCLSLNEIKDKLNLDDLHKNRFNNLIKLAKQKIK